MRKIAMGKVNVGKLAVMTILVNAFQIIAALFIAILVSVNTDLLNDFHIKILSYIVLFVICFGAYYDIKEALAARKTDAEADALKMNVDHLEEFNAEMRKQRHDFMNHLQVVYSLIEIGEEKEAVKYIENVHSDLARIGKNLKTSIPALNALISAKENDANEMGIAFTCNVKSALEQFPLESWKLCRITGNLIDNAFDALSDTNSAFVRIEITENEKSYFLSVSNNGPQISPDVLEKICEAGFSTKGENRGMGLKIVTEIIDEAGGNLFVQSTNAKTEFKAEIPKT